MWGEDDGGYSTDPSDESSWSGQGLSGVTNASLQAVSCPTTSWCIALGDGTAWYPDQADATLSQADASLAELDNQGLVDGIALGDHHASRYDPGCIVTKNPVNCASGDFWHTFTDVSIPGPGRT